ncbi:thioesterase II family protein [Streptomyces sp. NPDC002659]|uniref:thioesterase II family protein n=1 Tax=Streptomyces sp. NPDC002659 TaxID=3364656 RepID=UPI0036756613
MRTWFPGSSRPTDSGPVLVCLAGAGGGAGEFREWPALLGDRIAVAPLALPGRERRLREPPLQDWNTLMRDVRTAVRPWFLRPFGLFGHSFGALVMLEIAWSIPERYRHNLLHMYVSSQAGPRLIRTRPPKDITDEGLTAYLRLLGGTPEQVLDNKAFMDAYLPSLRADMLLEAGYPYRSRGPLDCPVTAFIGADDPDVTTEEIRQWHVETHDFSVVQVPGGHFSLRTSADRITDRIRRSLLTRAGEEPSPAPIGDT